MGTERLDKDWRVRGLEHCSTGSILGTLRHYGVDIDEERLRQLSSRRRALDLGEQWAREWKGTGPFKDLPLRAVLELWSRLGTQQGESLEDPDSFYEVLDAAPLDAMLPLVREAAAHPAFDEDAAFEMGARVADALLHAGRFPELEGVLDAWRVHAPAVHESSAEVLAWRTELALVQPGRAVGAALEALARVEPLGGSVPRLAEWCLYRGHVRPALAGLCEAWPHVLGREGFSLYLKEAFSVRLILSGLDVALWETPDMSEASLREWLEPFAHLDLDPHWAEGLVKVRSGLAPWGASPASIAALSAEDLEMELRIGVMALEKELLARHGWPRGRTQLIQPGLVARVMVSPGVRAGRWRAPEGMAVLLPDPGSLERWARSPSDELFFHPHAHAATTLALLPWGEMLRRLGWVSAEALAAWWAQVPRALADLPERLADATNDGALAHEVQQGLLSPLPPP